MSGGRLNLPNLITVGRIAACPVIFVLAMSGTGALRLLAFIVFLIAAFSDVWDGYLARKHGLVTDLGKLLDPRTSVHSGPAEYFRRFNRFFLFGQKAGGPVEAYLLDLIGLPAETVRKLQGMEIRFELIRWSEETNVVPQLNAPTPTKAIA